MPAASPEELENGVPLFLTQLSEKSPRSFTTAFTFTPVGERVVLRARANEDEQLLIEVEDECGGIPASAGDPFQSFGERRGGDINIHNVPGRGCVFTIDVPLASETVPASAGIAE